MAIYCYDNKLCVNLSTERNFQEDCCRLFSLNYIRIADLLSDISFLKTTQKLSFRLFIIPFLTSNRKRSFSSTVSLCLLEVFANPKRFKMANTSGEQPRSQDLLLNVFAPRRSRGVLIKISWPPSWILVLVQVHTCIVPLSTCKPSLLSYSFALIT